jgi:5-methyltetrahydropteroyltriglutamate--homocysteine methyltransferase
MLPTTVTGSWPRPRWFTLSMWGRPLPTAMMDVSYRELFGDALSVVISDQERAGLDILTNGDYFLDEDFAGRSWHHYALQRWRGMSGDHDNRHAIWETLDQFDPGTLLHEIYSTWRWPRVVAKVEPDPDNPLDYARIWRLSQARTRKPVKFGSVCAQVFSFFLDIRTDVYDDDKRQLIWDMSTAMNRELRELAAAGCQVIQLEDPILHYVPYFHPEQTDYIEFLIDAFNHEISGLEDVEVWIHTCWGNPNMQRVYEQTPYVREAIEIYLDRVKGDVLTVEMKDRNQADLELFGSYKDSMKKKIAIGVVSHRSLQVETPQEVAQQARSALRYINPENLVLSSDCGFGRQGCNRVIAFYKATAIAQGANIIRRELGLPETHVPAADPRLQPDPLRESIGEEVGARR